MKNYKRLIRRKKQFYKFKRRVDIWLKGDWRSRDKQEFKNEILLGESCQFLRTTLNPCNCECCSAMNKYKRPQKQYLLKEMFW